MLLDVLPSLSAWRVVLASASPRRVELLTKLLGPTTTFEVVPSTFPEDLDKAAFPSAAAYAEENARRKAMEVWGRLSSSSAPSGTPLLLVIASDSVVEAGGEILEKPKDVDQARRYLRLLSGAQHRVISGVCIVHSGGVRAFAATTEVHFEALPDSLVEAYIASSEPYDKAGGYGIQGVAGSFVTGIVGCFYNVMGFPLHRVAAELRSIVGGERRDDVQG
jgi:septum formation protein